MAKRTKRTKRTHRRSQHRVSGGVNKAIVLVETNRGKEILEAESRYDVMLNGVLFDQLYFNIKGYRGYLPTPPSGGKTTPGKLDIGEKSIAAYKKEVALLNKEWTSFYQQLAG